MPQNLSESSPDASTPTNTNTTTTITYGTTSNTTKSTPSRGTSNVSGTNITLTIPTGGVAENYTSESADATAPKTSPINPDGYIAPQPSSPTATPNPSAIILQTYSDVQLSNTNSALFGALTALGFVVTYQAWAAYRRRRKPIYLLNGIQTFLLFIKTLSATLYAVMISGSLNCSARSPLMNIPMVLAWDLIYGIMLIKLLLFTEWKKTVMVIIPLAAATHFAVVVAGIIMRTSGTTSLGLCTDKYPIVFKHQYTIELFLEVFSTGMLLHGIASKKHGMFAGTREVFRQLQANEHTRVFFAIIFVALKVLFTYVKFKIPTAATHAVDSARSAVVSWALTREVRPTSARETTEADKTRKRSMVFKATDGKKKGDQTFNRPQQPGIKKTHEIGQQPPKRADRDDDEEDQSDNDEGHLHGHDDHEDGDASFGNIPGFDFSDDQRRSAEERQNQQEGGDADADASKDTVAANNNLSSGQLV
ncbi:hypothetical protein PhCBS80983_g04714 [Powellomyces hirtus]|uniref:Uncharacterized protein n=1 Tax=Powellomyces hirtus TaxID=109895 RepID=A0A507DXV1_9FUNG|nr:hypothetical protein PhCBS80983_g04714 [Powellomyces hirtus]